MQKSRTSFRFLYSTLALLTFDPLQNNSSTTEAKCDLAVAQQAAWNLHMGTLDNSNPENIFPYDFFFFSVFENLHKRCATCQIIIQIKTFFFPV